MQKINFKKITIHDITTSAFVLVLIIISKQHIFNLNMGVMRVGISYPFLIVAGLILRCSLGLITVIVGDTLGLVFNGTIGLWHYAYFLIPILIFTLTWGFKSLLKLRNDKFIMTINLVIFMVIAITLIYVMVAINFANQAHAILVGVMFSFMSIYAILITIFYWKYKSCQLKDLLVINIIVSCIIVIVIWFYGPIAYILWQTDHFNKKSWNAFSAYQIPRVLKTPVILPLYDLLVLAIYKVSKQIKRAHP